VHIGRLGPGSGTPRSWDARSWRACSHTRRSAVAVLAAIAVAASLVVQPPAQAARVGRALQKHSSRNGSVFNGLSSGNAVARNEQGMRVLDEILEDPGATAQVLDNVTNIWDSAGRGIRLSNDGKFMGFLEPVP
jgi:hypothetical protein